MMESFYNYLISIEKADGPIALIALGLIAALFALLPRGSRRTLLATLVLFALHVVFLVIGELLPPQPEHALRIMSRFFAYACIGRALFLLVTRTFLSRAIGKTPKIFLDIIHGIVYVIAFMFTLSFAGVSPAGLLTGSALLTAILGLSLRDTLGNVFAGLAIQAQNPFEVGDWIQYDENPSHIGKVLEINWRATKVLTLDAVEIIMPNATLGQGFIVNFTRPQRYARRSIYFHAPYEVSPQRVHHIVLAAIRETWGVLKEPVPSVVTYDFDERGVRYWLRYFTTELDKRDGVDSAVRDRIWYAMHREGILFPAPKRNVQMHDVTEEVKMAADEDAEVMGRLEALGYVDFLSTLSEEDLRKLADHSRRRMYAPSEIIIQQGDEGNELFVIKQGEVVVSVEGETGASMEVNRLYPRSFFGEMSLLTGEPRKATVQAARECELLIVDKSAFKLMLNDNPNLTEHVCATIAGRQETLTDKQKEASTHRKSEDRREWTARLSDRIRAFFAE